jgi:RNA polymerase sigma-70 factor, ECF subfamily
MGAGEQIGTSTFVQSRFPALIKEKQVNIPSTAADTNRIGPELIQRAQQGDSDAFATLFHSHKTRVYSLCLRMTNNAAEAEDLAQDAFLQVFRKLSTFRGDSALSTWLYRIAVNTVLMHFRRKSPYRISLDEPVKGDDNGRPARREYGSRDGRLETSVTRVALARAISALPEGYRSIFLLHEVDGYQHREIAKMLGCSVGTSKSQLHKAKLRIREFLSPAAADLRNSPATVTAALAESEALAVVGTQAARTRERARTRYRIVAPAPIALNAAAA